MLIMDNYCLTEEESSNRLEYESDHLSIDKPTGVCLNVNPRAPCMFCDTNGMCHCMNECKIKSRYD